MSIIHFKRAS